MTSKTLSKALNQLFSFAADIIKAAMNRPISASKKVSQKKITKSLATYRRVANEPVPHLGLDEVRSVIRAVDVISKRKLRREIGSLSKLYSMAVLGYLNAFPFAQPI